MRHPIRAPFAGGLEAQNWHLADGLIRRGHDVVVFASGDSDATLPISPVIYRHFEQDFPGREHRHDAALQAHVDAGYERACTRIDSGGFDVVHNNSLHRFMLQRARTGGWRTITTLHTPPLGGLEWFMRDAVGPAHLAASVSVAQRALWWPDGPPQTAVVVPNGIDVDLWPFVVHGQGRAAWSGRITPDKGLHLAIDAARLAGMPLTVVGGIEDRAYFDAMIAPQVGSDVIIRGHLEQSAVANAIGHASVFLSTPTWPEPFGLAAIEALACGVPIAGFDLGAVGEVVGKHCGRYAVAGDVAGLARAMCEAVTLDRADMRRRVMELYRFETMIERYEKLYRQVCSAPIQGRPCAGLP